MMKLSKFKRDSCFLNVPAVFILLNGLYRKAMASFPLESLSSRLNIFPKDKQSHRDSLDLMITGRVSILGVMPG